MLILQNLTKTIPLLRRGVPTAVLRQESLSEIRQLWGYVAIAFNKVDTDRLRSVGPDRLCAEWLLKNGGGIRTVDSPNILLKDYNALPPEQYKFKVKVVDGTGSSIMKIGLDHFKGCHRIDTVIFDKCRHLEEDGLEGLVHLRDSLRELQVSGCDNIADAGLMVIGELSNLEKLKIFQMRYVENIDEVRRKLQQRLPKCQMDIK